MKKILVSLILILSFSNAMANNHIDRKTSISGGDSGDLYSIGGEGIGNGKANRGGEMGGGKTAGGSGNDPESFGGDNSGGGKEKTGRAYTFHTGSF